MNRIKELQDELKTVFAGRGFKILDVVLPLLVFMGFNSIVGLIPALLASSGTAVLFFVFRIIKKDNIAYALSGLLAVLLAAGFALVSDSGVGFFLPGLISGGITVMLCLGSILFKKPLAALSSHLTRNWPLGWYWHDRIRPAYSEVTLIWAVGFGLRLGLETWLYFSGSVSSLGLVRTLMGWPYTILLLVVSYLYGMWRLEVLAGPSVEEFQAEKPEPWLGQKKGF